MKTGNRTYGKQFRTYQDSSCEINDTSILHEYINNGCGVVTLENPETKKYKTYAFNLPRYDKFDEPTIFVYARMRDDCWLYVGMMRNNVFRETRNSNFGAGNPVYEGAKYIVQVANNRRKNKRMKIYHCGVCSVCGRKLIQPKSIKYGVGPKCRNKLKNLQ